MKQVNIALCLIIIIAGCKHKPDDDCIQPGKETRYLLDTIAWAKIPYNNYDSIVIRLTSTNDTLQYYADKWESGFEYFNAHPCKDYVSHQFRSLTFTCRNNKHESFNGDRLTIGQYLNDAGEQELHIGFRGKGYVFPMVKIGNHYQLDSVTVQGITYHDINFIPDTDHAPYPFGCFYNVQDGIVKMHFIDRDWPVPEGGQSYELLRR